MDGALETVLESLTGGDLERTRAACERDGDGELAHLLAREIDRRAAVPERAAPLRG